MRYLQRYRRLPDSVAKWLIEELKVEQHPYPSIHTALLTTLEGRIAEQQAVAVDRIVLRRLKRRSRPQTDLLAAMGRWAFRRNLLSFDRICSLLSSKGHWWARAQLVAALDNGKSAALHSRVS